MKLLIDIPYEAYYTFKCDLGKGNLNALAEIVANGIPYEERPQGEWTAIGAYSHKTFCPFCKKDTRDMEYDSFCPNCGAKMKKEVEGKL